VKILVYMKDGRQVFFLERRGQLADLVQSQPEGDGRTIWCGRGIWNPITGEYVWSNVGLRHIAKGSIALVEEAPHGLADAIPAQSTPRVGAVA
jgi:hypothetical protein